MQMLMTCIFTSSAGMDALAGAVCLAHKCHPASARALCVYIRRLYRTTSEKQQSSAAEVIPSTRQLPRWCKDPQVSLQDEQSISSCAREIPFTGVLSQRASMDCLLPWTPHSGTPFARLLLCMMRSNFSFLSLSKEENCVPRDDSQFTELWTLTTQKWK